MAIYKIVDAERLDGSLKASADAIRAKTGETAPISFDSATGFSSAIAAIQAGGSTGGSDLPAGYERVAYVKFNSSQIVDTGQIINQESKIRIMFTRDSNESMYMFGVVNSGNTASVTAYLASGGSWRFGNKSQAKTITANEDLVQCAIIDKNGSNMPNNAHTWTGVNAFETIGTLTVGATRSADGTVAEAQFIGKIILFQVWKEDNLVLNLIPVRGADGDYRLFDTVSGVYHDSITDTPLDGGNW